MKINLSLKHSNKLINLKHNNRSFEEEEWDQTITEHINRDLSKYNTTFIKEPIEEAYEKAFGEALKEYNAKQKKPYRQIHDYYEYIKEKANSSNGKKRVNTTYNLMNEIILTIGNKETWDNIYDSFGENYKAHEETEETFIQYIQYKKKKSDPIFSEFLEEFQTKHKHLYVFNAVAHYDQKGAPHMHMTFFGMAEGMKKGLSLQPRTTRAIAQDLDGDFYAKMLESDQKKYDLAKKNRERKKQGLKPLQEDRRGSMTASADVYKQFLAESKQIFINKAQKHGFEYIEGEANNIKDMHEYKRIVQKAEKEAKEKAEKMLQQVTKEIEEYKEASLAVISKETEIRLANIKESSIPQFLNNTIEHLKEQVSDLSKENEELKKKLNQKELN
jgi:mobilization protein (fragment)